MKSLGLRSQSRSRLSLPDRESVSKLCIKSSSIQIHTPREPTTPQDQLDRPASFRRRSTYDFSDHDHGNGSRRTSSTEGVTPDTKDTSCQSVTSRLLAPAPGPRSIPFSWVEPSPPSKESASCGSKGSQAQDSKVVLHANGHAHPGSEQESEQESAEQSPLLRRKAKSGSVNRAVPKPKVSRQKASPVTETNRNCSRSPVPAKKQSSHANIDMYSPSAGSSSAASPQGRLKRKNNIRVTTTQKSSKPRAGSVNPGTKQSAFSPIGNTIPNSLLSPCAASGASSTDANTPVNRSKPKRPGIRRESAASWYSRRSSQLYGSSRSASSSRRKSDSVALDIPKTRSQSGGILRCKSPPTKCRHHTLSVSRPQSGNKIRQPPSTIHGTTSPCPSLSSALSFPKSQNAAARGKIGRPSTSEDEGRHSESHKYADLKNIGLSLHTMNRYRSASSKARHEDLRLRAQLRDEIRESVLAEVMGTLQQDQGRRSRSESRSGSGDERGNGVNAKRSNSIAFSTSMETLQTWGQRSLTDIPHIEITDTETCEALVSQEDAKLTSLPDSQMQQEILSSLSTKSHRLQILKLFAGHKLLTWKESLTQAFQSCKELNTLCLMAIDAVTINCSCSAGELVLCDETGIYIYKPTDGKWNFAVGSYGMLGTIFIKGHVEHVTSPILDLGAEDRWLLHGMLPISNALLIPLKMRHQAPDLYRISTFGVLMGSGKHDGSPFSAWDEMIMKAIGECLMPSLESQRMYGQRKKKESFNLTASPVSERDINRSIQSVISAARKLLNSHSAILYFIDERHGNLTAINLPDESPSLSHISVSIAPGALKQEDFGSFETQANLSVLVEPEIKAEAIEPDLKSELDSFEQSLTNSLLSAPTPTFKGQDGPGTPYGCRSPSQQYVEARHPSPLIKSPSFDIAMGQLASGSRRRSSMPFAGQEALVSAVEKEDEGTSNKKDDVDDVLGIPVDTSTLPGISITLGKIINIYDISACSADKAKSKSSDDTQPKSTYQSTLCAPIWTTERRCCGCLQVLRDPESSDAKSQLPDGTRMGRSSSSHRLGVDGGPSLITLDSDGRIIRGYSQQEEQILKNLALHVALAIEDWQKVSADDEDSDA